MNVLTYRRANPNDNAGFVLDAQGTRLTLEVHHRGHRIVGNYSDVGSGMTTSGREGLAQMLDALAVGAGDGVLVTSLDRISRNLRDLQVFIQTLKELNAHLFVCDQPREVDLEKFLRDGPVWLLKEQEV